MPLSGRHPFATHPRVGGTKNLKVAPSLRLVIGFGRCVVQSSLWQRVMAPGHPTCDGSNIAARSLAIELRWDEISGSFLYDLFLMLPCGGRAADPLDL